MLGNKGTAVHKLCGTSIGRLSTEKQKVEIYVIVMSFMHFHLLLEIAMAYYIVMSTINNREQAEQLARVLLDSRLVACINIAGPVVSLYHWQDEIARDEEYLLLMKTVTTEKQALIERVQELHPYEVPEVIVLPILDGAPSYLSWLDMSVHPREM
jgi:periplasmic divalent cation tolerance protein